MSEPDLVAEVQEQHHPYEFVGDPCLKCNEEYPCEKIRLADKVERLREALEFYADKENYNSMYAAGCGKRGTMTDWDFFVVDYGQTARAALHGEEKE